MMPTSVSTHEMKSDATFGHVLFPEQNSRFKNEPPALPSSLPSAFINASVDFLKSIMPWKIKVHGVVRPA